MKKKKKVSLRPLGRREGERERRIGSIIVFNLNIERKEEEEKNGSLLSISSIMCI